MNGLPRIAITGLGVVSPVGIGAGVFFNALLAGQSGIGRLDFPHAERLGINIGASVRNLELKGFTPAMLSQTERVSQMAILSAREALLHAGQPDETIPPERRGVFVGCGFGGAHTVEDGYEALFARRENRVRPLSVMLAMTNAPAAHVGMLFQAHGPCLTYANACASGAIAIGEALRSIRMGEIDVALAGGAEALLTFRRIEELGNVAGIGSGRCTESGGNLSSILGRPVGSSSGRRGSIRCAGGVEHCNEARGTGARRTNRICVQKRCNSPQQAGLRRTGARTARSPRRCKFRSSDGRPHQCACTATRVGDKVETDAIRSVFGGHATKLAISATKSMHGHLMGAAGAIEFVATVQALVTRVVPPTMFLRQTDPELGLDFVANEARSLPHLRLAMSNSFAFGGTNAVLVAGSLS